MLIKSLEQMEQVVSKNRYLSWDGWDVIQSFKNPTGWMHTNGAFVKGRWYTLKRYRLSKKGWEIPNKLLE